MNEDAVADGFEGRREELLEGVSALVGVPEKAGAVLALLEEAHELFADFRQAKRIAEAKARAEQPRPPAAPTTKPDRITLGRIAFEAYDKKRGGLTFDGKPTPRWEQLGDPIREAWCVAAEAAVAASAS